MEVRWSGANLAGRARRNTRTRAAVDFFAKTTRRSVARRGNADSLDSGAGHRHRRFLLTSASPLSYPRRRYGPVGARRSSIGDAGARCDVRSYRSFISTDDAKEASRVTSLQRVSVFIGSSREGLGIAQALQLELEAAALSTIWYQGVFGLSQGTLESLEEALPSFDFAILVITPDDVAVVRDRVVQLPRDNVLFELGLFMGHLGRRRVFVVYCDDGNTKLPSDLAGITVAKIKTPDVGRPISDYTTTALLPIIGPTVTRIRAAIHEVQKTKPRPVSVHYIAPTLAHNSYYAQLQTCLEAEISHVPAVSWHFHLPSGDTAHDIYATLKDVLRTIRPFDCVVLVPKQLDDPHLQSLLHHLLAEYSSGRLIFIDEQPPASFLELDRTSFIGVDDYKVGLLAAFALSHKLATTAGVLYCALQGPGGEARTNGFLAGLKHFDPHSEAEIIQVGDVDRIASLPAVRQLIDSCGVGTPLGIFAGNDETAFAVMRALQLLQHTGAFVVGCDATREMRVAIDSGSTPAIATIDTNIRRQAKKVVEALSRRVVEFQEPQLYPLSVQVKRLLRDPGFANLWRGES